MSAEAERLLSAGQASAVAGALDALELQSADSAVLAPPWPAAAHMLAHILNDDLEDARFVWKRLPPEAQAAPPARAAFGLLQAVWARDLEGTAAAAAALPAAVAPEGPAAAGMAGPVRAALRSRAGALVAKAYTRLPLARLASLLGCGSEAEAAAVAREWGWSVGEGGEVGGLRPLPRVDGAAGADRPGAPPAAGAGGLTLDLLDAFVDYVVELEA